MEKKEGSQPESLKGKSNIAMEMSQMHSYRHPNAFFRRSLDLKPYLKPLSQEVFRHEIPSHFMNGMPRRKRMQQGLPTSFFVSSQRDQNSQQVID